MAPTNQTPPTVATPSTLGSGTTVFAGTVQGSDTQNGIFEITIQPATGAAAVSGRRVPSSANPLSVASASGTLYLGMPAVTLTGTFDSSTSALALSGGGFTVYGKLTGTVITGTYQGPGGSAGTLGGAWLTSITIDGSGGTPAVLGPGGTLQLAATGNLSDHSSLVLTGHSTWTSSNRAVMTVNDGGAVMAATAGIADITATFHGVLGSVEFDTSQAASVELEGSVPSSGDTIHTGLPSPEVTFSDGVTGGLALTFRVTSANDRQARLRIFVNSPAVGPCLVNTSPVPLIAPPAVFQLSAGVPVTVTISELQLTKACWYPKTIDAVVIQLIAADGDAADQAAWYETSIPVQYSVAG